MMRLDYFCHNTPPQYDAKEFHAAQKIPFRDFSSLQPDRGLTFGVRQMQRDKCNEDD